MSTPPEPVSIAWIASYTKSGTPSASSTTMSWKRLCWPWKRSVPVPPESLVVCPKANQFGPFSIRAEPGRTRPGRWAGRSVLTSFHRRSSTCFFVGAVVIVTEGANESKNQLTRTASMNVLPTPWPASTRKIFAACSPAS